MSNEPLCRTADLDDPKAFHALARAAIDLVNESRAAHGLTFDQLSECSSVDSERLQRLLSTDRVEAKASLLAGKEWHRLLIATRVGFGTWITKAADYDPRLGDPSWTAPGVEPQRAFSVTGLGPPPEVDAAIRRLLRTTGFFFMEASKRYLQRSYAQTDH
jgi:hypothetical protein